MAILHVAQLGHPVLRLVAKPVEPAQIATAGFQRFCDDLLMTMDEYDGTGLAAPQVHVSLRVAVLALDADREPEFLINPIIIPVGDELGSMMEGCLSIDGLRARVHRPRQIRVRALDRQGKPKAYLLRGFPAIVTQHECDHLDGVLFVDRCDPRTMAFLRPYRRFGPLDLWFEEQARGGPDDDGGDCTDAVESTEDVEPEEEIVPLDPSDPALFPQEAGC